MGPNSQRRRNASQTLASTPARARFSNWRPPVKKGRGERDQGGRGRGGRGAAERGDIGSRGHGSRYPNEGRKVDNGSKNMHAHGAKQREASGGLALFAKSLPRPEASDSEKLPKGMSPASLDTIAVSSEHIRQLLAELNTIFNQTIDEYTHEEGLEGDEEGVSYEEAINLEKDNLTSSKFPQGHSAIQNANNSITNKESLHPTPPCALQKSKQLPISLPSQIPKSQVEFQCHEKTGKNGPIVDGISALEKKTAKQHLRPFLDIGFSEEELVHAFRRSGPNADEDEAYLALLLHIHPTSPPQISTSIDVIRDMEMADRNVVLREENDALEAIYPGGLISIRRLCLLNIVCNVIDLSSTSDASVLRVIVYNAHLYPSENSLMLGWYYDSNISPHLCREASLSAMKATQEGIKQSGTPQVFDFIQHVLSIARGDLNEGPLGVTDENEAEYFKSKKQGEKNKDLQAQNSRKAKIVTLSSTASTLHSKSNTADNESKSTSLNESPAAISSIPSVQGGKKISETTPEYRSAFLKCLNDGLTGMDARKSALSSLEYVLPRSVLDAIWKEEEAEEEIRKKAFDMEQLGKGGEIEATKQLSSQGLSLPKAKLKALLAAAKKVMIEEGRGFARNSEDMKKAWVKEAMQIHIQRLERDEAKAIKKQRLSRRGPTLRDAYEILEERRAELQEQDEYDEDDDDDYDEDGEDAVHYEYGDERDVMESNAEAAATLAKLDTTKSIFSPESCSALAAMKQMARLRLNDGEGNDPDQIRRREEQEELDSRRLNNEMVTKKASAAYRKMLESRSSLPAFQMRDEIIKTISNNHVTVICGATGCGKTTQVPQLIFDAAIEAGVGGKVSMVITQPRRISAISVSERIAQERIEKIGQTCGYHIRLEQKRSAKTRLLLMTTGVLLRLLQVEEDLTGISHLFIDEVHERDIQSDFLLIILKTLMQRRPDLKVVLMSATLNADIFSSYFKAEGCALLSIPGRAFPVTTYYLEDALQHTGFVIDAKSDCVYKPSPASKDNAAKKKLESEERAKRWRAIEAKFKGKCSKETLTSLEIVDETILNKELIRSLCVHLYLTSEPGAILIFVPGIGDIRDVIEALKEAPEFSDGSALIYPLHSSLSSSEQSRVFAIPPPTIRKIIVSTNIAETSVTIPDVVYVIDSARVKENRYDETSQLSVLEESWVSQANAMQRRGRAGRVRSGVCYCLASGVTYDSLPAFSTPEMLRLSLEEVILQILALELGDPYEFLGKALSPPDPSAIKNALVFLDNLSAVNLENRDDMDENDMDDGMDCATSVSKSIASSMASGNYFKSTITPLGYHLASLPLNPRIGKLILYGLLMDCIDPILTIASIVSAKSPFLSPFDSQERERADMAKQKFLDSDSDLLTMLNAYLSYKQICDEEDGKRGGNDRGDRRGSLGNRGSGRAIIDFCRVNYLSVHSLDQIDQMREQFLDLLKDIGFLPANVTIENVAACSENKNGHEVRMIKSVLCAGLAPNILQLPMSSRPSSSGTLAKKLSEISFNSSKGAANPIYVHPSSVMSESTSLDSAYVIYLDAMKTAKVYVRDVTTVSPLIIALFASKFKVYEKLGVTVVDGWLGFKCSTDLSGLLVRIRQALEEAFVEKVVDPSGSSDKLRKVVQMVKTLTLNDISKSNPISPVLNASSTVAAVASDKKPGDWVCLHCHSNNFASRSSCFRCNKTKEAFLDNQEVAMSCQGKQGITSRDGDWICSSCSINNFASRSSCFKCGLINRAVGGSVNTTELGGGKGRGNGARGRRGGGGKR